jgi:uncharacterized protein (UPF0548 family)
MLSLRRPTAETIDEFLATQAKLGLTYPAVGATATVPPGGYTVDHTRIKLGEGEAVFSAASAALGRWDHFRLGWLEACPPEGPIEAGAVVALLARFLGLWWLNACRVVYVVDEGGPIRRFGFACGTQPTMVGRGRSDSPPNGTGRVGRSGTTSWPTPGRTNSLPDWGPRICMVSRSDSGGSRRRPWPGP